MNCNHDCDCGSCGDTDCCMAGCFLDPLVMDPPEVVVTVPATGAYLVIDGVVHETFEEFPPYVEIEASWRQRWSVTTKTRE